MEQWNSMQDRNLTAKDFGGEAYEGCNEYLVITRPMLFKSSEDYLAAGADIVETNTFGAPDFVLGEFDLQDHIEEVTTKAVELARACDKFSYQINYDLLQVLWAQLRKHYQ